MDKQEVVLAALAASGGAEHSPAQVQKLIFLLEMRVPDLGGPHFNFEPYDYGPFDPAVYWTIDRAAKQGLAEISVNDDLRRRTYRLSPAGQAEGERVLSTLPPRIQQYIRDLSRWVLGCNFAQLVSSVYKAYPQMKVNSVFRG